MHVSSMKDAQPRIIPVCRNPWDNEDNDDETMERANDCLSKQYNSADKGNSVSDAEAAKAILKEMTGGTNGDEDDDGRVIPMRDDPLVSSDGGKIDNGPGKKEKKKRSQLLAIVMNSRAKLGHDSKGNVLNEAQRLKRDLNLRPEEERVDGTEWDATPIEGFGSAMLRGMGWKGKGTGVGLNRSNAPPVEITARPRRLGLGATAKPWEKKSGAQQRQSGKKRGGGLREGCHVGVVKGPYVGDVGSVVDVMGSSAIVALEHFGDKSQPRSFLTIIDSPEAFRNFVAKHPPPKEKKAASKQFDDAKNAVAATEKPVRDEKSEASSESAKLPEKSKEQRKRGRERSTSSQVRRNASSETRARISSKKRRPVKSLWVRPHIRVRCVGRAHYREKARILDVVDPVFGTCLVQLEDGGIVVEGIKQRDLETVLPKAGGEVIVLAGSSKGLRGRLLERSTRRQTAVVQFHEDLSVKTFSLDDVSQYYPGG
eukprot:g1839.t1